ncbi:MAG: hypothetical protein IPH84_08830 [Bacteroidales bacterium]|nr:hypothetical protein [Bacteroidales bacterium]
MNSTIIPTARTTLRMMSQEGIFELLANYQAPLLGLQVDSSLERLILPAIHREYYSIRRT